ncbi:restriction endonuclease fold toxin 5 domain-containing protein [Myxococcus stipitatus]|uniref:Tox-REase-5 domain-containing protein n=1 Tax=Myxococcus stipitatus TaxID=83455 RepID=UPI00314509C2
MGTSRREAEEEDAWEKLLTDAGLEARDSRPMAGSSLTPLQALRMLGVLLDKGVTLGQFPARVAVGFMLREVLERGEVSRAELARRAERFSKVAVLRPDGYLAWVQSGRTQQRVAPVEWKNGAFRAHGFELGRFYDGGSGVFRLLDADLREATGFPIADVHDDADVISRSLDGAEEAFVGLALAVGKFFSSSPAENLDALRRMPAAVVALLESSPEYLERFKFMTRGEQVQVVSKMVTSLIATWGTAATATRTLQGTALATAEVPLLSLSAQGTVAMRIAAAPTGRAAAVLSGGPGAAIILQRVNEHGSPSAPSDGPGRWEPAMESMTESARRYEKQVTGAPDGFIYKVEDVKFDGFKEGVLLEAKGPGYAKFIPDAVENGGWYQGFRKIVLQAERQLDVANGTPVCWHFAEREAAEFVREILRNEGLGRIRVVFTPPAL